MLTEHCKSPTQGGTTGKHKNDILLMNFSGCGSTVSCCFPAASALRTVVLLISPAVGGRLLSMYHLLLNPLHEQEMKQQSEAAVSHITPSGLLSNPHITFKCVSLWPEIDQQCKRWRSFRFPQQPATLSLCYSQPKLFCFNLRTGSRLKSLSSYWFSHCNHLSSRLLGLQDGHLPI